jgi:tripartite-type tricarboxylate transporter receptor subunit TctC
MLKFSHRRQFLQLAAVGVAVSAASWFAAPRFAWAQAYPTRPVRIVVGFPAGGSTDVLARLIGHRLSERLGQQFLVENRPGAGGNIATEAVVKAAPDGYTLLMIGAVNTVNTTLYGDLNFTFHRDITPIAGVMSIPQIIDVHPSVPAKTLPELVAFAKANPGKLNMASAGLGTPQHMAGELFKMMAGVDMLHVPYRGGAPAIADLVGGQVQVMFDLLSDSIQYIRAGRLRPLAVTTASRLPTMPDVPSVNEFLPGYETSYWVGLGAPKNLPNEITDLLNKESNLAVADPMIKASLDELGGTAMGGSSANFGKLIVEETERWGKVVRAANLRAE